MGESACCALWKTWYSRACKSIIEPVKHSDACLLERHGVLTVDSENLDNALLKAYYVEQVAELYYRALQISGGKEPAAFTEDEFKA